MCGDMIHGVGGVAGMNKKGRRVGCWVILRRCEYFDFMLFAI